MTVSQIKDKGTAYPVAQILVNCANAYDKKEVEPELVELAKFAKHHVPEDHEKVICQLLFYQLLITPKRLRPVKTLCACTAHVHCVS